MNTYRSWRGVALLALVGAVPAVAQEQVGSIDGTARDESGAVLAGVTVVAASAASGAVQATSDARGDFRFPSLPSGIYSLNAALAGFKPAEATGTEVILGKTTRVDLTMKIGAVSEAISVVGENVGIDIRQSATSTSIRRDEIEKLPHGRDYTSVVSQAPGAASESMAGGISIDGSSGSENRFIIDGMDTTHPQTGVSGQGLLTDVVEEVQVKSAGYAAEYGGSTGGVINAITKSGGNRYSGSLGLSYENNNLYGSERPTLRNAATGEGAEYVTYSKDDYRRTEPSGSLSGPVWRDKAWFFVAYRPEREVTDRRIDFTPGGNDGVVRRYETVFRQDFAIANLTANFASKLLLKVAANTSPDRTDGQLPGQDGRGDPFANYDTGGKGRHSTVSAYADYVASPRVLFSLRAGDYTIDSQSVGIPSYENIWRFSSGGAAPGDVFADMPADLVRPRGFQSVPLQDIVRRDRYERRSAALETTYFLNALGEHTLKAGIQAENLYNDVRRGYNGDFLLYRWDRSYTTTTGEQVRGKYGYFLLFNISTLGDVKSENLGLFVQDSWTPRPNWTVNLGVRTEREQVPNYNPAQGGGTYAIKFNFGDKIAPRLGVAWDVRGDQRWKAYSSYGVYYDITKLEMPRGSFGGDKWVDYAFTLDSFEWMQHCSTGSNTIAERPNCPAGTFIEAVDRRFSSASPLAQQIGAGGIESNLKPMESHEFQLGLQHQWTRTIAAGARYIHKEIKRTIEDVGVLVPGVGEVFFIANPGEGIARHILGPDLPALPKARRDYDALELTLDRRFSGNWSLRASYTYSRLYGNYSGLASSDENGRTSPNVDRFFDGLQTTYDQNGHRVYGLLATDRPHRLDAVVTYRLPWGTTLGFNQYVASGTPVSTQVTVPDGLPFFPYGRGDLGRTPTLMATDLALSHPIDFGGWGMEINLTVLNLFDRSAATHYNTTKYIEDLPLTAEQFFAGFNEAHVASSHDLTPNPLYGKADTFQAKREVRLAVRIFF